MAKDRPILFNADNVRAVLDGRKTQTRRVVTDKRVPINSKCSVHWCKDGEALFDNPGWHDPVRIKCPFGKPGDRLWARETFAARVNHACGQDACDCGDVTVTYAADNEERFFNDDSSMGDFCINGRKMIPSIHMPRWASRITLEIKSVRVERLQDISEEDAQEEGVSFDSGWEESLGEGYTSGSGYLNYQSEDDAYEFGTAKESFRSLWSKINGADSWNQNPWVWVIEFDRVK